MEKVACKLCSVPEGHYKLYVQELLYSEKKNGFTRQPLGAHEHKKCKNKSTNTKRPAPNI